jgi:hypothetical protein
MVAKKKNKKSKASTKKREFARYLERIEDPKNNREVNYDLPENPTPLQVAKFEVCQKILGYKLDKDLSRQQIAQKIDLSLAETEDILFCCIEKFTLDRLMTYANNLFSPSQIKVIIEPKPKLLRTRKNLHVSTL